jgi:hypothetical protein
MITERIWEGFDITAIENIEVFGDTSLLRYFFSEADYFQETFNLPKHGQILEMGNGSFDNLWIQRHTMYYVTTFKDGTKFKNTFKRGFLYDKASKMGKNNIQEGVFPTKGHDQGCSTHCFDFLPVNQDSGFRSNNLFFYHSTLWWIANELKAELAGLKKVKGLKRITRAFKKAGIKCRAWRKRRRAKLWYVAVNSIVGQGFYETNKRDWHKVTTSFEIISP